MISYRDWTSSTTAVATTRVPARFARSTYDAASLSRPSSSACRRCARSSQLFRYMAAAAKCHRLHSMCCSQSGGRAARGASATLSAYSVDTPCASFAIVVSFSASCTAFCQKHSCACASIKGRRHGTWSCSGAGRGSVVMCARHPAASWNSFAARLRLSLVLRDSHDALCACSAAIHSSTYARSASILSCHCMVGAWEKPDVQGKAVPASFFSMRAAQSSCAA